MTIKDKILIAVNIEIVRERYRVLSELWIPGSKHKTHIKISKWMDETLAEENKLRASLVD